MDRLITAFAAGYAAFGLAVGVGIPIWRDWPSWQVPADAVDIAFLVFLAALGRSKKAPAPDGSA